jgi:Fur family ferric uptake transcriptional regulator
MKENVKSTVRQILTSYLESNHYRRTPERYAVLDNIYSFNGQFSIDQLDEKLKEQNFPVSRATLYNTVKLFLKLRLIVRHRIGKTTKFEACYANSSKCYQICTMCGKTSEVKAPAVKEGIENTHLKRFHPDVFTMYIYGICSTCLALQTRQKRKKTKNHIK